MASQVERRTADAAVSDAYLEQWTVAVVRSSASPVLLWSAVALWWIATIASERSSPARRITERDYSTSERCSGPALGLVRYDGASQRLLPGQRWFSFTR